MSRESLRGKFTADGKLRRIVQSVILEEAQQVERAAHLGFMEDNPESLLELQRATLFCEGITRVAGWNLRFSHRPDARGNYSMRGFTTKGEIVVLDCEVSAAKVVPGVSDLLFRHFYSGRIGSDEISSERASGIIPSIRAALEAVDKRISTVRKVDKRMPRVRLVRRKVSA